jgi:hypothetical protein
MLFDFKKAFVGGLSLLTAVQGRPTQPRDGGNSSSLQSTSSAFPTPDAVQVFPTKGNTVNRQPGLVKKQSGSSINPADLSGSLKDLQTQPFPGRPGWKLVTDRPASAQDGVISIKGLIGTEGPPEVDGPDGWKTKLGFGGGSAILLDNYDTNTTYATGYNDAHGLPPDGNVACFVLGRTTACDQDFISVTSSESSPTSQKVTKTSPTTPGVTKTSPTTQGETTTSPTTLATGNTPLRPTSGSPSTATTVVYVTAPTQTSGADRGPQPPGAGAVKLAINMARSRFEAMKAASPSHVPKTANVVGLSK